MVLSLLVFCLFVFMHTYFLNEYLLGTSYISGTDPGPANSAVNPERQKLLTLWQLSHGGEIVVKLGCFKYL